MGPRMITAGQKIPPAQAVWQVLEVVMNAWILWVLISQNLVLPLILWTVLEIGMNGWILLTMFKVGISKLKKDA